MKSKVSQQVTSYALIVFAAVAQAFSLYIFIIPNTFSPGGVSGIATMIEYITGIESLSGYLIMAMNVPLLILSFIYFKRDFTIKTAICIVISSVLLVLFPLTPIKSWQYTPDNKLLAAIAGGCISGVGLGFLLRMGACNGGSEIIGRFIQKKFPQYNIAWCILVLDTLVVLSTAFVIEANAIDIIILSMIKMFCTSIVCSTFLEGINSALKFEIVTMHPDELCREIVMELGRGVTKISARGGYTGQEKTILICLIRKKQISTFQRILKNFPDTFAYIMNTKEVYGRGFSVPNADPKKFGSAINAESNQEQQKDAEAVAQSAPDAMQS